MYAQLGNIIFAGLNGFDSFERVRETDYAEHSLIEGKPRLQRIGEKLETITIALSLHASFCNPQAQINALDHARTNGEILPLLNGSGDYLGNYVIKRVSESAQHLAPDGKLIWVRVSVELSEYSEANAINQKGVNARALAVTSLGEVPAQVAPLSPVRVTIATPAAAIVQSVQGAKGEAFQVEQDLKAAATNPTGADALYNKVSKRLSAIDGGLKKANEAITKSQNAQTEYANLQSVITNTKAKTQVLKSFVDARNSNEIGNANIDLQNEIRKLNTASAPFATKVALRK